MLAAILLAGTNAFAEAVEIDGIWYNLVSKAKVAEVTNPTPGYINDNYTGAISIPEAVTYDGIDYIVISIGDNAFGGCENVTSVTIPISVVSIGFSAFSYCSLESITIPNSVTTIGNYAFGQCKSLTSITLPNSLSIIKATVFMDCSSLTSIIIPNSVTGIQEYAFSKCGLRSIIIPNNVKYISSRAFQYCGSLTSITIGSGVHSIGGEVFSHCPELTDVYCYAENVPSTEGDAFDGSYIDCATLHVPVASVETYKTREPWSGFDTIAAIINENSSTPIPAGTYAKADLKRTFAEGWNTICLPFAIDNIEAAFGTGAKAYGFDDFADGELKFSQVTSLAAGTPYVIYVPAEITELIAFENINIEESNTISSNIDKNGACFRGTYAPVAAGEWTKNNSTDNIYGITPDGKIRKAGSEASILGLRAYFDIPAGTEVKGFVFEDEATGIKTLSNPTIKGEDIYNLAGQRLNKAQKGINIVSGKKVLY